MEKKRKIGGLIALFFYVTASGAFGQDNPRTTQFDLQGLEGVEGSLTGETALAPLSIESRSRAIPKLGVDAAPSEDQLNLPLDGEWGVTRHLAVELGLDVVKYQNVGGKAVFEGDIVIGLVGGLIEPIAAPQQRSEKGIFGYTPYALFTPRSALLWTGGLVPWCIAPGMPLHMESRIREAMNEWAPKLGATVEWEETGVIRYAGNLDRCTPPVAKTNRVRFIKVGGKVCDADFGRSGTGEQEIRLSDSCTPGDILHEMGHAIGMLHEHTRLDREDWIKVIRGHIKSPYEFNFTQARTSAAVDVGSYDYGSIMHYRVDEFSNSQGNTLEPKRPVPDGIVIGQREHLSDKDVASVKSFYALIKTGFVPGNFVPLQKFVYVLK